MLDNPSKGRADRGGRGVAGFASKTGTSGADDVIPPAMGSASKSATCGADDAKPSCVLGFASNSASCGVHDAKPSAVDRSVPVSDSPHPRAPFGSVSLVKVPPEFEPFAIGCSFCSMFRRPANSARTADPANHFQNLGYFSTLQSEPDAKTACFAGKRREKEVPPHRKTVSITAVTATFPLPMLDSRCSTARQPLQHRLHGGGRGVVRNAAGRLAAEVERECAAGRLRCIRNPPIPLSLPPLTEWHHSGPLSFGFLS
jgi:hypothetical protein